MSPLSGVWCALLGVPVGSFLNVVVDRTPSRTPLRARLDDDVTPPLSWLGVPVQPWVLRGAGASDRRWRWLAVELTTALVFGVLGAQFGRTTVIIPLLVFAAGLVAVSFVDLEHLRIPDRITFPTLGACAVAIVLVSVDHSNTDSLGGAAAGAAMYFLLLLAAHLASPRGMGFGDVKLALLLGLVLGWLGWEPGEPFLGPFRLVLQALLLGCVLGVVFGLGHQAITKRRGEFPFGPSLALGCLLVVLSVG